MIHKTGFQNIETLNQKGELVFSEFSEIGVSNKYKGFKIFQDLNSVFHSACGKTCFDIKIDKATDTATVKLLQGKESEKILAKILQVGKAKHTAKISFSL